MRITLPSQRTRSPFPAILCASALAATACDPALPSYAITVQLALECEPGATCTDLAPPGESNPALRVTPNGTYSCSSGADATPTAVASYQVTSRGGTPDAWSAYRAQLFSDAIEIVPYEAPTGFRSLYDLTVDGQVSNAATEGSLSALDHRAVSVVADHGYTVVARYPSRQPGRTVVETHRVVRVGDWRECTPSGGNPQSGWGPY